jgi:hypothetical protein
LDHDGAIKVGRLCAEWLTGDPEAVERFERRAPGSAGPKKRFAERHARVMERWGNPKTWGLSRSGNHWRMAGGFTVTVFREPRNPKVWRAVIGNDFGGIDYPTATGAISPTNEEKTMSDAQLSQSSSSRPVADRDAIEAKVNEMATRLDEIAGLALAKDERVLALLDTIEELEASQANALGLLTWADRLVEAGEDGAGFLGLLRSVTGVGHEPVAPLRAVAAQIAAQVAAGIEVGSELVAAMLRRQAKELLLPAAWDA